MRTALLLFALAATGGPALAQTDAELLDAARAFPPMPQEAADLLRDFAPELPFTFGSGTPFNDLEYTLYDTDYIDGETNGFDTFLPVDPSEPFPGTGTVKLVRGTSNLDLEAAYGGPDGDRVILGTADVDVPFFLKGPDGVDDDYAVIQNIDYASAFIQLRGGPEDYRLLYAAEADGVATEGHYLFYTGGGAPDLIAFIWPCDVPGLPVSGAEPRNARALCNASGRLSLEDGVGFRFAPVYPSTPAAPGGFTQFGTSGKEIVGGVATDARGNVYVFGASGGSLGGALEAPEHAIFVAQFDREGNRGWTAELAATNGALLFDAVADDAYLYAVGRTLGALPGFESQGRWDGIILKLDLATGELVDADQYGTPNLDGYGNVTLDGAGGLYVSGAGAPDDVVGTDAEYLVAKHATATLDNVWRVIEAPAATGPVFVSEAWGGLSYAPAQGDRPARLLAGGWYMSTGGSAGFLSLYEDVDTDQPRRVATATLNSTGTEVDWVLDNAIGPDGSLYAAGYTTGDLAGAPSGAGDAFVVRFGADLEAPAFVQVGTPASDMFRKLEVAADGGLYAVGYTYGDAAGANADPERRSGDVLVQSFGPDLAPRATAQFGTPGEDRGFAALGGGVLVVGGTTEGSLAGPSSGSFDGYAVVLDAADLTFAAAGPVSTEPSGAAPDASGLSLYPNPTAGAVTLETRLRGADGYAVVDALGRVVRRGGAVAAGAQIDLSGLADGVYVVRLTVGDEAVSRRIVKR